MFGLVEHVCADWLVSSSRTGPLFLSGMMLCAFCCVTARTSEAGLHTTSCLPSPHASPSTCWSVRVRRCAELLPNWSCLSHTSPCRTDPALLRSPRPARPHRWGTNNCYITSRSDSVPYSSTCNSAEPQCASHNFRLKAFRGLLAGKMELPAF